jgi:hypothetical protein
VSGRHAPVVVFAYMREDHLRRSIESLLTNPEASSTDVVFYCDAAKRPQHQPQVDAVRAYVDSVSGFRSVSRVHREENMGLARSIIDGVTKTLERHGRAIVLEDDLVVSRHFLRYMNEALELYRDDPRVASIHGYCYPTRDPLPETFFLAGADCWGWATWSRAWATFQQDGATLLRQLRERNLTRHFDYNGQYPYTRMLEDQVSGRNSSWAVRWHASCFLQGLLTLYPGRSLVDNIGNDSTGTHCGSTDIFAQALAHADVRPDPLTAVQPSLQAHAAFEQFFRERNPLTARVRRWLSDIIRSAA